MIFPVSLDFRWFVISFNFKILTYLTWDRVEEKKVCTKVYIINLILFNFSFIYFERYNDILYMSIIYILFISSIKIELFLWKW